MTVLTESEAPTGGLNSPPRVKMRMLEQMAEALEDQVAGLYRRAAAFEEEEFLLNHEVEERQTEINRLILKLEAMRADRDRVMERIETISSEAAAIREEVFNGEEEAALAAIENATAEASTSSRCEDGQRVVTGGDPSRSAMFFRRMTLADQVRHA
jgi:predicted RNase H-like nuclease (RuvC/YqgF family)